MRGKDTGDVSVVYAYSIEGKAHKGLVKMAATPPVPGLQPNLPPDCATLTAIAKAHAEDSYAESGLKVRIVTAAVSDPAAGEAAITPRSAEAALRGAGIPERKFSNRRTAGWFKCPAARLKEILYPETAAETGETDEIPEDIMEETPETGVRTDAGTGRVVGHPGNTHKPADAMDWDEALEPATRSSRRAGRWRPCSSSPDASSDCASPTCYASNGETSGMAGSSPSGRERRARAAKCG